MVWSSRIIFETKPSFRLYPSVNYGTQTVGTAELMCVMFRQQDLQGIKTYFRLARYSKVLNLGKDWILPLLALEK